MQLIKELATTPYGANPKFDDILNHVILVFNVIQNPDGRVAGTRANGNGFDMNRDFLTQSQSEVRASVALMQKWLPVEVLDLHGYVTPTLIEATTKPHNPSIEYDLWLKWNQDRIDFNEAAMHAVGLNVTRPINDWCEDGSDPDPAGEGGVCDDGTMPGPAVAESWDDWGPFYTPMYAQHVGLDGSTVEMCNSTGTGCGVPGSTTHTRGRLGAFQAQYVVTTSSLEYVSANRNEMLYDEAERYRRGVEGEPRVDCCDPPLRRGQQLDEGVPDRVRDPGRHGPAVECRGQAPRRLAAPERHRGGHAPLQDAPSTVRRSTRAPMSSGWTRRIAGSPTPRLTSASTSPTGSASSTPLPRPGATATCGAPT